jgi:hypothetical protein
MSSIHTLEIVEIIQDNILSRSRSTVNIQKLDSARQQTRVLGKPALDEFGVREVVCQWASRRRFSRYSEHDTQLLNPHTHPMQSVVVDHLDDALVTAFSNA